MLTPPHPRPALPHLGFVAVAEHERPSNRRRDSIRERLRNASSAEARTEPRKATMALSLILFDCDGVLVDSEIISAKVDASLLKELGYEISANEIAERFAGLTQDRILELLTAEAGIRFPEDYAERQRVELDRRLAAEITPIAGVHEMLDRLDLPRAICSNSSSERLKIVLEPTKLWDRFRG